MKLAFCNLNEYNNKIQKLKENNLNLQFNHIFYPIFHTEIMILDMIIYINKFTLLD